MFTEEHYKLIAAAIVEAKTYNLNIMKEPKEDSNIVTDSFRENIIRSAEDRKQGVGQAQAYLINMFIRVDREGKFDFHKFSDACRPDGDFL